MRHRGEQIARVLRAVEAEPGTACEIASRLVLLPGIVSSLLRRLLILHRLVERDGPPVRTVGRPSYRYRRNAVPAPWTAWTERSLVDAMAREREQVRQSESRAAAQIAARTTGDGPGRRRVVVVGREAFEVVWDGTFRQE